ncbi:hypothetical protein OS190_02570 [Sulfitobacter sp. F26204]|uniref:hypothetical protein n=1 Tax=Sulfitobacter sp. F26204 TaxID=2996014 RepID=UPI00225DFE55|nr:hypothetical protein [Sulfitobacter sp. F26204]MCX7558434.1 hypothetical protein [Sulfitobacter sp. F26204]
MTLFLLFLVFFIGGPLAFRGLTGGTLGQGSLGIGTAVCAATGLGLRYGLPDLWGYNPVLTVASLALIWFAWIGVLAYGAQKLRQLDGGLRMRRWTGMIGAAGTTMPWFGLVSANLIQG